MLVQTGGKKSRLASRTLVKTFFLTHLTMENHELNIQGEGDLKDGGGMSGKEVALGQMLSVEYTREEEQKVRRKLDFM